MKMRMRLRCRLFHPWSERVEIVENPDKSDGAPKKIARTYLVCATCPQVTT